MTELDFIESALVTALDKIRKLKTKEIKPVKKQILSAQIIYQLTKPKKSKIV